jgi:hypothetical protein
MLITQGWLHLLQPTLGFAMQPLWGFERHVKLSTNVETSAPGRLVGRIFVSWAFLPLLGFLTPRERSRAQESLDPTHWDEDGASRPKLTPGKFDASAEWFRGAGKGIGDHPPLQRLQANRQFGNIAPTQAGGFQSAPPRFAAHYNSFKCVRVLITPAIHRLMKVLSH